MKDRKSSLPAKGCTAKQVRKAVGCRIIVGYVDSPAQAGILLPDGKNGYQYLTVDTKGRFEIEQFDEPDQVIHIDESSRRPLLDMIFASPAEAAAKAELNKRAL